MEVTDINVGFKSGLAIRDRDYATSTILGRAAAHDIERTDSEIYFESDNPDEVFERVTALNIKLVHSVKTQPWQQRVFRFYDPDGFIVETGETMDITVKRLSAGNLSIDEIAVKTFLPREAILAIMGNN